MRDFDIRMALRAKLKSDHLGEADTLIIEELGLLQGNVRVDIAVVNGSLHGFEIKSERDTLERLPRQRDAYDECFDAVTLVVGQRHLERSLAAIPARWGVLIAQEKASEIELVNLRDALPNPHVKSSSIVQLLWRDEVLKILSNLGIDKGLRTKPKRVLWEILVRSISPESLRNYVRESVKARGDWRAARQPVPNNGSSPTAATVERHRENLEWLLSQRSPDPLR